MPKEDLVLDEDWRPLGLCGTGSVDALAEKIFVPGYRSIDSSILLGARSEAAARQETTLYKTPILPCLAVHISIAMLAFAQSAFEDAVKVVSEQKNKYTPRPMANRPGLQFRMAESAADIRAAELMLADTLALLGEMAIRRSLRDHPNLRPYGAAMPRYRARDCGFESYPVAFEFLAAPCPLRVRSGHTNWPNNLSPRKQSIGV